MSHPHADEDDGGDAPRKTHYWYFFPVPKSPTPLNQHKLILVFTVTSATLLLVPPRTFGRNVILGAATIYGANHLHYDWTNVRYRDRSASAMISGMGERSFPLPPEAAEARTRLRHEKELRKIKSITDVAERKRALDWFVEVETERKRIEGMPEGDEKTMAEFHLKVKEYEEKERRGEVAPAGFWKRIWMGEEKEGWQYRRWKEHKEIFDSGGSVYEAIKHDIQDAARQVFRPSAGQEQEGKKDEESKQQTEQDGEKDKTEKPS